jgi:outer membrane protein TolC
VKTPIKTSTKLLSIAVVCLSIVILSGCHTGELAPFDPRSLGENERTASGGVANYPMHPLPTTLESPFLSEGGAKRPTSQPVTGPSLGAEPQVRMTLQEIVHRAVLNSSDIKTAAYQPAIDETRVTEAEARFDPTFFSNMQDQFTRTHTPFTTAEAPNGIEREENLTSQVGIRQNLQSGGSIDFHQQFQWIHNKDALETGTGTDFNHQSALQNDLIVELSQPLLRDFGNDINQARIVINRNTQGISLLEYRKQIEETISDIEKSYWDLVEAERDVKIQEDLLGQTIDSAYRLTNRRGTDVTRVQISQTNSRLESRRADLIRFKAHVKDLSAQLKRDMQDPDFPISGPTIVLPADEPLEEAIHFDQQDIVDTALSNRFELGEQQLRIDSAHTATLVGKNNLLPQLNAVGSVDFEGLSAREDRAIGEQANGSNFSYAFGLEFEIPIGNREARAIYQRSLLQQAQAQEQYRAAMGTVTFDCDTAVRAVQTSWDELAANRRAVFSAQDTLHGMEQRESAGEPLTPEFVELKLDYQDQLASSRRDEATAVSDYNKAIAGVEQAKGTLLQFNNVVMQRDDLPYERKLMMGGN